VKRFLRRLGLRRRGREAPEPDPAEELRAKLAESRVVADDRDVDEGAQTTVDAAPDPADPDARRRDVHARAREALDELQ
jgi:hypothetical protein